MKSIEGTKLLIPDQIFHTDGTRYVKVTDLIEYFKLAIKTGDEALAENKRNKSKTPNWRISKVTKNRIHIPSWLKAIKDAQKHMIALEYGYEGGSTAVNIPNNCMTNVPK